MLHHTPPTQALARAVALLALLLPGCGGSPDEVTPSVPRQESATASQPSAATVRIGPRARQSHVEMRKALAHFAELSRERHPYLGTGISDRIRAALDQLPASAPARARWEANFAAGDAELKLGRLRSAIGYLEAALALAEEAGVDEQGLAYNHFQLGVAYMRLGETENCCKRNAPESCILPLRGAALHTAREGSTRAIGEFLAVLATDVGAVETAGGLSNSAASLRMNLAAQWLLNLAYMTLGEFPDGVPERYRLPADAFESAVEFPRLENVGHEVGLDTFNLCGGLIVDDFDGDEHLDVVASSWDPDESLRFFHNRGDGTFEERTRDSGLEGILGGLNCMQTDYNGDGLLDLFVLRGAWLGGPGRQPNSLLKNLGGGRFVDVTLLAGMAAANWPTQAAAWADYDADGDLDVFIGNESTAALAAPSQLYRNEGNGTFTEVAGPAGVLNERFAKAVSWGDFDEDGWPDLYVSNYGQPNRLYRNQGDGTFVDVAPELGVTRPEVSFPAWFWDYDNDGHLDLFASAYTGRIDHVVEHYLGREPGYEPAALYRGTGGEFEEVALESGLRYPMLPMGANFGDLDGDGFLDMYLGTGDPEFSSLMPNVFFWNQGGQRFADATFASGLAHLQKGHGVAFGDLENDGDLDLLEQLGGAFRGDEYADAVYRNPGFGNAWIGLRLEGRVSNRPAIGARIHVRCSEDGEERSIYRWVNSGGSFGASSLRQTLGLGQADHIVSVEIDWPAPGGRERIEGVKLGAYYRVVEGTGKATPLFR